MEITTAKTAGFCFGVSRAMKLVDQLLEQGKKVCTLGPIIHNPQAVQELSDRGVVVVDDIVQCPPDGVLVIRSHGVEKKLYEELNRMNIPYMDATCPFVEKIHRIVENASLDGNTILIAGDETHPEVIGIKGFAKNPVFVFKDEKQLGNILNENIFLHKSPLTVVSQTTFDVVLWRKCEKIIKKVCTNAKIFDTICDATSKRQEEAQRLSCASDLMIVIGGRQSSNTAKLKSICERNCDTVLVEMARELPADKIRCCKKIGVTAGASTPAVIIKDVLEQMSKIIDTVDNKEDTAMTTAETMETQGTPATTTESEVAQESSASTPVAAPQKSFDEMSDMEALEYSLSQMSSDQHVKGYVLAITPTEIQVDIGRKHAGYVPIDEYSADPDVKAQDEVKVGDVLDLIVMRTNDQEGTVMLSKKRFDAASIWEGVCAAAGTDEVFTGKVIEIIKGGVLVLSKGIRVFIPASQATASRNEPLDGLLHQTVQFRILEVDRRRRRAIGSIRALLREQRKEQEAEFWANIEEGKVYTGKVKSMTSYGAFVDLGGVDGMVHISELSWRRIKNPSEVVSVGDIIEVYVKSFDPEKHRVSLGYKKPEDNPWNIFVRDYQEGDVVNVRIVSMTAYGAFANIIEGVDGLIHISQIAHNRIAKPQDVLEVGQQVDAKIIQIDIERKRISLSIRALTEPETESSEQPAEEVSVEDNNAQAQEVTE